MARAQRLDKGTTIQIGSGLPDEAYQQLFSVEIPRPTREDERIELIWNGSNWTWATMMKLTAEIPQRVLDIQGEDWRVRGWKSVQSSVDVQVEFQWDSENRQWTLLSLPKGATMFELSGENEDEA